MLPSLLGYTRVFACVRKSFRLGAGSRRVLRFGLNRGVTVPLEPQNPFSSLRVILAEKGTHC